MKKRNRATYERLSELPLPHETTATCDIQVGLVVPPSPFVVPCGWEWVHSAPFEGPSILAALIKGLGYRFRLLDQRNNFTPENLSGKLSDFDIIGFATYEDSFPYIKKVIELITEENPEAPIVLGGSLVTSIPELMMNHTEADYAVLGEGELTTIELMDMLTGNANGLPVEKIDGLAWKNQRGEVMINKPRKQMDDLDAVPFQDFSVWEMFLEKEIPEIYMSTSRGCQHNCSFCYRTMPKYRLKSLERVKKEIQYLRRYGFEHVWWNDLCFSADKKRTHALMDEMVNAHQFTWNCFNRVTGLDLSLLKHMKKAGCDIILYGFEAVSRDILDGYRKGITKDDMIGAIHLTGQAGIKVGGLFIIGAPEETRESLDRTIEFCREFKEITRVKYLSAIPGTSLYRQAVREGIIRDETDHLYYLAREQSVEEDIDKEGFVLFSKKITKEDLRAAYRAINTQVEKRPYEYEQDENTYLKAPRRFRKRPVIPI